MRAVKVPLPVLEIADGVSSYPVSISLIFLKPWPRTIAVADTRVITAIDPNSLRIPFTSQDYVVAKRGAHDNTGPAQRKQESPQRFTKITKGDPLV
jgi:hypothetical protein